MRKNINNQNGFSLVELIVVISIIAVFVGISVNVYRNSVNERRFQEDIELVTSIVHQTRGRAMARDISPDSGAFQCRINFQSYNLLIDPGTNSITQQIQCNGMVINLDSHVLEYSTITFPGALTRLRFVYPVNLGINSSQTISLRNETIGRCVDIDVPANGAVVINNQYSC